MNIKILKHTLFIQSETNMSMNTHIGMYQPTDTHLHKVSMINYHPWNFKKRKLEAKKLQKF